MSDAASDPGSRGSTHGGQSDLPDDDAIGGRQGQADEYAPQFTSRASVKHVVEVLEGLSEFKMWLVTEMGFGGMLKMKMLQKLSLKFSAWIMSKVDIPSRSICITEKKILRFWAEDVHKVFGVPCGNHDVRGRDATISE
jgi:hypothetical protein